MMTVRRFLAGPVLAGLTALALIACGSDSDESSSTAPSTGSAASGATEVAASLKDGKLDVFSAGDYPPYNYLDTDGKTMLGMEDEMLDAIAKQLGVQIEYHVAQFDTMIPGIANDRADLMVMAMADTPERRKQVDFIDLYKTNYRVVTRKGNSSNLSLGSDPEHADVTGLCGKTAAVVTGSAQEQTVKWLNEQCSGAGKPRIDLQAFPKGTQEYLAVKSGRADFDLFVPANADFFLKENTDLEAIPGSFPNPDAGFTGWILAKDDRDLQDTLLKTINGMIDDGTWARILSKWGVSENDAVLPPMRNSESAPVQ